MNKDFKVGDVVVFISDERKEKDLLIVIVNLGDKIKYKSVETGSIYYTYKFNVRHATLKEQYLRTDNIVQLANGDVYLVLKDRLVDRTGFVNVEIYNDDLKAIPYSDVIKVYEYESEIFGSINSILEIGAMHNLIWERKPKINLTDDEVVILRYFDKDFKRISRNEEGHLSLTEDEFVYYSFHFTDLFQSITFESGSHLIADLIKENEND